MINPKKILIIISIILLFPVSVCDAQTKNGDLWKVTCTCPCGKATITAFGIHQQGLLDSQASSVQEATKVCQEQCARTCGSLTACSSNDNAVCASCCQGYCSGMGAQCIESCSSSCSYTGVVNNIVEIIYLAAGVIAAIVIVICGVRILTAQDPGERNAAKRSIMYVIIALIIIILAATLVGLFLKSATAP